MEGKMAFMYLCWKGRCLAFILLLTVIFNLFTSEGWRDKLTANVKLWFWRASVTIQTYTAIWFSYFNIQQLQSKTESSWLFIPAVWSIRNIAFTACIFFWTTISKTWIPVIVNIFERYFSTIKELPHLSEISWHSHFLRFILSFRYYVAM